MRRLAALTVTRIMRCWADHLGCAPEHLRTDRTLAVPHAGIGDYHGVFVLRFGQALVASVPPPLLPHLGPRLERLRAAHLVPEACVRAVGEAAVDRVIGPAHYGYADATALRPIPTPGVRSLTPDDAPLLDHLRAACSAAEWDEAGALTIDRPLVGQLVDAHLVAVAGYAVWWACLAHIGVITAPAHRGQGYGRAVAYRSAEAALNGGLVPQYRALAVNRASMALATALGFEQCATSIALRLTPVPVR